jgi:hypothetical protein
VPLPLLPAASSGDLALMIAIDRYAVCSADRATQIQARVASATGQAPWGIRVGTKVIYGQALTESNARARALEWAGADRTNLNFGRIGS